MCMDHRGPQAGNLSVRTLAVEVPSLFAGSFVPSLLIAAADSGTRNGNGTRPPSVSPSLPLVLALYSSVLGAHFKSEALPLPHIEYSTRYLIYGELQPDGKVRWKLPDFIYTHIQP